MVVARVVVVSKCFNRTLIIISKAMLATITRTKNDDDDDGNDDDEEDGDDRKDDDACTYRNRYTIDVVVHVGGRWRESRRHRH